MSAIFDNAADSLKVGIGVWLNGDQETSPKHAILNIFHAIELLLKERLHREHVILIYKNLDRPISDNSETVGLYEVLARYKNIGVSLSDADAEILKDFKRRRNRIEHHSYTLDPSHNKVIGKALRFVFYFLRDHLDANLEGVLDDQELYDKALQEILDYEEQLKEAMAEVEALTEPKTKDDLLEMPARAFCPECGVEAVVIGSPRGDYCFMCREEQSMEQCPVCGDYVDSRELEDCEICANCGAWRI